MSDSVRNALASAGSAMAAAFAAFAHAAAPIAVAALWQGAAVAVALVLALRIVSRVSASHRFAAWAAAFAMAAAMPLLPLLAHSAPTDGVAQVGAPAKAWFELDSRWGFAIAALWLAASAARAAQLAVQLLRLRDLSISATPIDIDPSLRALLAAASQSRVVVICTTRGLNTPSVIGFFRPRILIPGWLLARLTPGELEQVVLHEAEHLRRRDDWTNLAQKFALALFPLNPALAWIERRLCREREMACDEGVVRRTQAPRAYAACLTSLAERGLAQRGLLRRAQALSLGAFERRPELVHRVHSILKNRPSLHPVAARALVGVVGCGLLAASIELARCPQWVAFVAPEAPVQTAALAPRQFETSRAANERDLVARAQDFRAIQTKAILPANQTTAAQQSQFSRRHSDESSAGIKESNLVAANEPPRAQHVKAVLPYPAPAADQQVLVFTAWEQVETFSRVPRTVADYDSGDAVQQPAHSPQPGVAQTEPATRPAQITVTHLIFVVVPASSALISNQPHATSSQSHQPSPTPLDSGWLVFQL